MPLGKLNRDIAFFQDLRDNNSLINAIDFDNQFNQVIDFINSQMIPIVNSIAGGAIPGIDSSPNTFLHNIGDGSTNFVPINNTAIPDFVLEFSKLAKSANSCAILATGEDNSFVEVASDSDDQVLISINENMPVWRKIQTDDIENRTIPGGKLALNTITAENMIPGTLINNLPNNSILGNNFTDQAVANPKIIRNSLELRNLGVIWPDEVDTRVFIGTINNRHVALRTLSGDKVKSPISTITFNLGKCIISGKILPQNITDLKLEAWTIFPGQNGQGHFPSASLSPNFKLTSQELALNYFLKAWFEPTAEVAFTNHGCL